MKKNFVVVSIFILWTVTAHAQSNSEEIQRLQALLNQSEQRALKAEENARSMRYLAVANELAELSVETQDKELSALLAVLAQNLNVRFGGYMYNNKIYNALVNASRRYDRMLQPSSNSEIIDALRRDTGKAASPAVLPNSTHTVVPEQNGNLKFVTEDGLTIRILSGHTAQVDRIKFSQTGLMATAGKDNTIRIWNLSQLNQRPMVITESNKISNLAFSTDNNQLIYFLEKSGNSKDFTIKVLPLDMKATAADLCNAVTRDLTKEDWWAYVGSDLPYERTCSKK